MRSPLQVLADHIRQHGPVRGLWAAEAPSGECKIRPGGVLCTWAVYRYRLDILGDTVVPEDVKLAAHYPSRYEARDAAAAIGAKLGHIIYRPSYASPPLLQEDALRVLELVHAPAVDVDAARTWVEAVAAMSAMAE